MNAKMIELIKLHKQKNIKSKPKPNNVLKTKNMLPGGVILTNKLRHKRNDDYLGFLLDYQNQYLEIHNATELDFNKIENKKSNKLKKSKLVI